VRIGDGSLTVAAGPCAVESETQLVDTATHVAAAGASLLRGGAYKPRSSPYSFRGLGAEGLEHLQRARELTGLPVVTEVLAPADVAAVAAAADMLQVGTRNAQNFSLLEAVGEAGKPVLLKRGLSSTDVVLCERGIRTFETGTRNTLDLSAVPLVQSLSHLPVIVDPSHATGHRDLVPSMALAAVAAGADGLLIEVHPSPDDALSDGPQSLTFEQFDLLMNDVRRLVTALRHQLVGVASQRPG
jgi:3-deoxy-7-phosphoheptulonate synthase